MVLIEVHLWTSLSESETWRDLDEFISLSVTVSPSASLFLSA